MSFAFSWPLQRALVAALQAEPTIAAEVGPRIYDAPPHLDALGDPAPPFILIGDETVDPWSTADADGAMHALTLSVIAADGGFARLKAVAAAVSDAALGPLTLERGRVAFAQFVSGRTRQSESGALRRIDLRFRIAVEDV